MAGENAKSELQTQSVVQGDGGQDEGAVEDGVTWKHAVHDIRQTQRANRTPNVQNPGYVRQKQAGKLWVYERLDVLLDRGSFQEIGSLTGKPVYDKDTGKLREFTPANSVTGSGKLNGRKVFVTADDFSVRGGHADGGIAGKAILMEALAAKHRVPLVRLLDGSSGGGSVATYLEMGATYIPGLAGLGRSMDAMAVVPVASALLGPVVGLAAAKAVTSHFSVMVKGLSQLFAAGPPVVKQATFEDLSKEALGGWDIHARNGTIDNVASSEFDAFHQIRTFLSFLPSSALVLPPTLPSTDPCEVVEELIGIIPRRRARTYDIRKLIRLVVDSEAPILSKNIPPPGTSFFEIGATWGRNVVTGFARLRGRPVGILASDCMVGGGAIDALGSQKTARFVNLCDHFNLPLLNLVDQPGFAVGFAAEKAATIRHGATAMFALYSASIPIYTVVLRRAFGIAGGLFADPDDGCNTRVAWPSADWGSLPLEGGIEAAYKRELDGATSPAARDEMVAAKLAEFEHIRSPTLTANQFGIEEIVDPRDTRRLACEWCAQVYRDVLPPRLVARQAAMVQGKRSYKL